MKTARLTLLTTPEFKAFLGSEAARDGISVAELVRTRCEPRPDADETELAMLTKALRKAVAEAHASLHSGLEEAEAVLAELSTKRARPVSVRPTKGRPGKRRTTSATKAHA